MNDGYINMFINHLKILCFNEIYIFIEDDQNYDFIENKNVKIIKHKYKGNDVVKSGYILII